MNAVSLREHWRSIFEKNKDYYKSRIDEDPYRGWEKIRSPLHLAEGPLGCAFQLLYINEQPNLAQRYLKRTIEVAERAVQSFADRPTWRNSLFPMTRGRQRQAALVANVLLGNGLDAAALRDTVADYEEYFKGRMKGSWPEVEEYHFRAACLLLISGQIGRARELLGNGKKALCFEQEQSLINVLAFGPQPPPPREEALLERFDRMFEGVRDPRTKPLPQGSRISFELAALRDKYFISPDATIDWRRVIDLLGGAPLVTAPALSKPESSASPKLKQWKAPPKPRVSKPRVFPIWIKGAPTEHPPLRKQLTELASCGIGTNPELGSRYLEARIKKPLSYAELIRKLGNETPDKRRLPVSNNVWHFDAECVEGAETYINIARRFHALAGKSLPMETIDAGFDNDGKMVLRFRLANRHYRWRIALHGDWVDNTILKRFNRLLIGRRTGKVFVVLWSGVTQDCTFACLTTIQLKRLRHLTGLNFRRWTKIFED